MIYGRRGGEFRSSPGESKFCPKKKDIDFYFVFQFLLHSIKKASVVFVAKNPSLSNSLTHTSSRIWEINVQTEIIYITHKNALEMCLCCVCL